MKQIELFLSDPRYIALDDTGKKAALDRYFNKYVPQDSRYQALDEAGKQATYKKFMDKYYAPPQQPAPHPQPKQRSLREMMSPEALGTPSLGVQPEPADNTNVAAVENFMADKYRENAQIGYERGRKAVAKEGKPKNILEEMDAGFTAGLSSLVYAPAAIDALIHGDKYSANYIQGAIDERLSQAGYDDMDMGKAISEGKIKKAAGMALKTFAQSAPTTLLWLATSSLFPGSTILADEAIAASSGASKYTQLDREMPELSTGRKLASAANAGFWEAASEEIGNRVAFMNKYVRTGSKMGKAAISSLIKKEIGKTTLLKAGMGVGLGALGEGGEELLNFNGEYWADVLLGITEHDPKAYITGSVNSTLLGMSAGGIQGGMAATYSNLVNARYTNLQSKLEKAADIDLTKITDKDKWNAAKNLKQLAQNTQTAIEFAQGGDTEAALQLAKENLGAAQRIVSKEGSSAISSVGMYNALLVDTLTEYGNKEEGTNALKNVVSDNVREAIKQQEPQVHPSQPAQADYATIQSLVDKAMESKAQTDIDAANAAVQSAINSGDRSEQIQVLQTTLRTVKPAKAKGVNNDQENKQGLPGKEQGRQESVQAEPDQAAGTEAPQASGVVQAPEGKVEENTFIIEPLIQVSNDSQENKIAKAEKQLALILKAKKDGYTKIRLGEHKDNYTEDIESYIQNVEGQLADIKGKVEPKPEKKTEAKKYYKSILRADNRSEQQLREVPTAKAVSSQQLNYPKLDLYLARENDQETETKNKGGWGIYTNLTGQQIGRGSTIKEALSHAEQQLAKFKTTFSVNTSQEIADKIVENNKKAMESRKQEGAKRREKAKKTFIYEGNYKSGESEVEGITRILNELKKAKEDGFLYTSVKGYEGVEPLDIDSALKDAKFKLAQAKEPDLFKRKVISWEMYKDIDELKKELEFYKQQLERPNQYYASMGKEHIQEEIKAIEEAIKIKESKPAEPKAPEAKDGIDTELIDAIKNGEAWLPFGGLNSIEWDIAVADMKKAGTFWGVKDQHVIDEGIRIMEDIDRLGAEIENNKDLSLEDRKKRESEIKKLQEKHRELWISATKASKNDATREAPKAEEVKPAEPIPTTKETFQQQWRDAQKGKLTEEQLDAQLQVLDAMISTVASELGKTEEEIYAGFMGNVSDKGEAEDDLTQRTLGFIKFDNGKANFTFLSPNITTGLHEQAHLGRAFMAILAKNDPTGKWAKLLKDAEDWCNVKNGEWTTENDEQFALGFEKYCHNGIAPTAKLKTVFEKIRQWIGKLIARLKDMEGVELNQQIIGVYDALLGGEIAKPALTSEQAANIKQIDALIDKINKSAVGRYSPDMAEMKQELGALIMPNLRLADRDSLADVYMMLKKGEITQEQYDAYVDDLISSNKVIGTTEEERKAAMDRVYERTSELYKPKEEKAEIKKPKLYAGTLISHYKAQGLSRTDTWNAYVRDVLLTKAIESDILDAKEVYAIYDAETSPKISPILAPHILTSEQKKAAVKIKAAAKDMQSNDPTMLEKQIDKAITAFPNMIMSAKYTAGTTSMLITDVDTGQVAVEIVNKNGETEVNGFYVHNNAEAVDKANEFMNKVLKQTQAVSDAEIAEAERQMAEVRAKYEGTGQWLKAPNGKPTKLNERQWLQVRTQLFKDWFGDWENDPANASKVVDENGEPMVVYHGTGERFMVFDITKSRSYTGTPDYDLPGIYFTPREEFSADYGDNVIQAYLSIKKPFTGNLWEYKRSKEAKTWRDVYNKLTTDGYDGVIESEGANNAEEEYIAFSSTQIKSATGNVGTFSNLTGHILYQISTDQAIASASPEAQERIAKIKQAAQNAQARARATYRNLRTKMNTTTTVSNWETLMRKALITSIKNSFPGTAPLNVARYEALKEQLDELDPGIEEEAKEITRIKRKLRQMIRNDERFRDALQEVSGGYEDVAYIPFEQLFNALSNTNPAAYDMFMNDEAMTVLLKVLPRIKEGIGQEYNDKTLQMIVNSFMTDSNPYWGVADWTTAFLQPQRYLTTIFGKAGAKVIDLAYQGTLANSAYEHEYEPYLNDLHRLLMTAKNNRGSAYIGGENDIIGRTIFEVDGDSSITDKLPTIQQRLADWSKTHSAINPKDVAEIYAAKEAIKDTVKDFIIEWNADPAHKNKIGIRENYDNPRNYKWGGISEITTKFTRYLFTPANAKKRAAEDLAANLDYNTNIFEAYRNYAYAMTKYMAFADLANYVEDSTITIPIKDKETGGSKIMRKKMGSQFDLDLSMAQRHAATSAREYLSNYVRDAIGYHKHNSPGDRILSAARSNLYTSTLALNMMMTVLNYNQRNLIFSAVDPKIAWQVKDDFNFWSGLFKDTGGKYPTLAGVMQKYVIANQSLLAELSAEVRQNAEMGETKISKAYYSATAKYNELLKRSVFSLAELGNRAWAHAAGVYQVVQNSQAFKDNVKAGMDVHEAMDKALAADPTLRRAAITYGGIINAEVNADANPAFAPAMFREHAKLNKVAAFMRYGTTITLLELRTYGGAKDLKSALSPDLFNLIMSGNVQAATAAQTIQAAQIMKSWTSPARVAKLVKDGKVSKTNNPNMLSVNQMGIVHEAVSWALDEYTKSTEKDFADIVRGKQGARKKMAAIFAFSLSEMLLRFVMELMLSLIPWWQGKKQFTDTDVIYNISTILGLSQTTKTLANYRLGVGLIPDLNYYNKSNKQVIKSISQFVLRLTPFAGSANYAGKLFMGKYYSDQFWDKVYE